MTVYYIRQAGRGTMFPDIEQGEITRQSGTMVWLEGQNLPISMYDTFPSLEQAKTVQRSRIRQRKSKRQEQIRQLTHEVALLTQMLEELEENNG